MRPGSTDPPGSRRRTARQSSASGPFDPVRGGAEDKNRNGRRDAGETAPQKIDTDGDGFNDRVDRRPLDKRQH
ncbi:MAG TPA: hypothetical protein VJT75_02530 [Thermoleophilaceae bacterium]|nr:hypothetical protein [Thermoleophilaceae bacterium]